MSAASTRKLGEMSTTEMVDDTTTHPNDPNALLQEAMGSHLDMMLDIIMQIRQDENFAKSIYTNCPRLQHFLDQHPDLRPIFDDPRLVRVNFEDVYRKAGGLLPEDKPTIKQRVMKIVGRVVQHPLFRVLRFLLFVKKMYNCIMAGGVSCVRGLLCGLFLDAGAESTDVDADGDDDGEGGDVNPENDAGREQLMRCADYMEGRCGFVKRFGVYSWLPIDLFVYCFAVVSLGMMLVGIA